MTRSRKGGKGAPATPTEVPEEWPTPAGAPSHKKRQAPPVAVRTPDRGPPPKCPDCQQFVPGCPGGLEIHAFKEGCGYPPKCNVSKPKQCRGLQDRKFAWLGNYWQCPRCCEWIGRRHRSGDEKGELHEGGPFARHAWDLRPTSEKAIGAIPCYYACVEACPDSPEVALMNGWMGNRVYCPAPGCREPWQRIDMVGYHFLNSPDCGDDREACEVIGAALVGRPEPPQTTITRILSRHYGWEVEPEPAPEDALPSADEEDRPTPYQVRNTFIEFGAKEEEGSRSRSVPPGMRYGATSDGPAPPVTPEEVFFPQTRTEFWVANVAAFVPARFVPARLTAEEIVAQVQELCARLQSLPQVGTHTQGW